MKVDPAELEVFKNLFHSVAEEMGAALRRSAFSPNIKERRDYSCAVFDGNGRVVAMGDHMPVHLGSMPMSVAAARLALKLGHGDIAVLNDPYTGGTHLPDITLVMPVATTHCRMPIADYRSKETGSGLGTRGSGKHLKPELRAAGQAQIGNATPLFYVANRAHHSDMGGAQPASMGLSEEIYQEGLRIPPVILAHGGEVRHAE